jgi:Helix-turn-helix domain
LGPIQAHERCVIHRRRAGWSVKETAAALGRCRTWVGWMERGRENCDELVQFWKS